MRRLASGTLSETYEKNWNSYAELVHDRKASRKWSTPRQVRRSHFDEFFRVDAGDLVLDAGCGHGDYSQWLLERGSKVFAFDYAPAMVSSTANRLSELGLEPEDVRLADVTDIPYPDEMFDAVLCLAVLDHLSDERAIEATRELARVAKPGARVYLNVPMRRAYGWRSGHRLMQMFGLFPRGKTRWYLPEELRLVALAAGLEPNRTLGLWALPPFSGIYTSDIRRLTIFPPPIARSLDRLHLFIETRLRRIRWFQPYCLHFFLEAHKPV